MFSLVRELGLRVAVRKELPAFLVSFGVAEIFYKFGSFTLELCAFLATWTLLSFMQQRLLK